MKVLITGANGMLGKDLCPVFEDNGLYVFPFSREDLDITDCNNAKAIIETVKPQIIINLASYTNVEKAEEDEDTAFKINKEGVENIAKISKETGAILVHISTDYVFDGTKNLPYTPSDTPNPLNKYGLSKLKGEEAVQKYADKYYIIRTSWLYGLYGKNFVETMVELANKGNNLNVVDDQTGTPTYTVDLAMGILNIIGKPYGIYHIANEGETSWFNFAKEIFKLKNMDVNVSPCTSDNFKQKAKRPKYSVLRSDVPMRGWAEALKDYIKYKESLGK